jgi:hypothetical protein
MAELTEAVAEVAEGVAEDALAVANISRSLSGREVSIASVGVLVGGSLGGLLTFWWSRRHFDKKLDQMVEDELDEMREYYRSKLNALAEARVETVTIAVRPDREKPDLEKIIEDKGYVPPPPGGLNVAIQDPVENAETAKDIAESMAEDDWNYVEELESRSPDRPYVIHQDEYGDREFACVSLTYYDGDDILSDEDGKPVDDKDKLIGEDNLSKFGHGSNSPHIVHIRNESLSLDIELIKDEGNFITRVHGLRHSERRPRRLRFDDEET